MSTDSRYQALSSKQADIIASAARDSAPASRLHARQAAAWPCQLSFLQHEYRKSIEEEIRSASKHAAIPRDLIEELGAPAKRIGQERGFGLSAAYGIIREQTGQIPTESE